MNSVNKFGTNKRFKTSKKEHFDTKDALAFVHNAVGFRKNLQGDLSLAGHKIVDLAPPSSTNEAVTLGFVKTEIADSETAMKQFVNRQINKIKDSQVFRRVYSFRSNLETRDKSSWLAENGQQYYVASELGRITKVLLLAARVNNQFQVTLQAGTHRTTVYKMAGEVATVLASLNVEFQTGNSISVVNSGAIPSGHHTLEIHCEFIN